ncbi:MAG: metallophosphoesterase [Phycisphaerales bacterium]|nr:metallophosphoesterase [Phycisphaerales bacterium]
MFDTSNRSTRRAFLQQGALVLLATGGVRSTWAQATRPAAIQIGLLTDLHYADREHTGSRYYRDTLKKAVDAVKVFNERKCELAVMLGDMVDAGNGVAQELEYLKTIEQVYAEFKGDRHYVLGNHCVWNLTKELFRQNTASKATYYSFDRGEFHIVILDACYRLDGVDYGNRNAKWTETEIPLAQRDWLRDDLEKNRKPTLIFVHQRLDETKLYSVQSRAEVRTILEESGQALAVFQGHNHRNDYQFINGLHYVTLRAMVEDTGEAANAYAVLNVYPNGDLKLEGFKQQNTYEWPATKKNLKNGCRP